jgi:hypothetical protein
MFISYNVIPPSPSGGHTDFASAEALPWAAR